MKPKRDNLLHPITGVPRGGGELGASFYWLCISIGPFTGFSFFPVICFPRHRLPIQFVFRLKEVPELTS